MELFININFYKLLIISVINLNIYYKECYGQLYWTPIRQDEESEYYFLLSKINLLKLII